MVFDFDTFSRLVVKAYKPCPYSLEDVLSVFRYYFQRYEDAMGRPHPHIRAEQIGRIIQAMPWVDEIDCARYLADIEPEDYKDLIDQHFRTRYRNCDYNINHFFSGRVRELRLHEVY